jgi:hypothetical protein
VAEERSCENRGVSARQAIAVIVLCLTVATGCGKSHHSELVLKVALNPPNRVPPVFGKPDKQELDEIGAVLRRRIDLLGIHDAKMRLGRRIAIVTRRPLTPPQRRVLTKKGSLAIFDLEADLAPASRNGSLPSPSTRLTRLLLAELRAAEGDAQVGEVQAHIRPVRCRTRNGCPGAPAQQHAKTYWYLFKYYPERAGHPIPEITERDLRRSRIRANVSSTGQGNVVLLDFNRDRQPEVP